METWGRIVSGILELIASIVLLLPSTVTLGAVMALAATGSAILFHLTRLGVALTAVGDHGELFALALVVVACSLGVLLLHRQELPWIRRSLSPT
jgi:hypothetical protein